LKPTHIKTTERRHGIYHFWLQWLYGLRADHELPQSAGRFRIQMRAMRKHSEHEEGTTSAALSKMRIPGVLSHRRNRRLLTIPSGKKRGGFHGESAPSTARRVGRHLTETVARPVAVLPFTLTMTCWSPDAAAEGTRTLI